MKDRERLAHVGWRVRRHPLSPPPAGDSAPLLSFCKLESFGAFSHEALSPLPEGD
jgi:hypothetical protein